MVSYDTLLRTFRAELKEHERYKKDTIVKLVKKLEEEKYPTHDINNKLVFDLQGYIGKSYISQILEDKYKDLSKRHVKEKEKEEEVAVTTEGETVVNDPELEEERKAKEEFTNEFNQALNNRAEETKSLNDVVVNELDKEINYRKELEQKLEQSISHEQYESLEKKLAIQQELMGYIEDNLGYYMVFEKEEETGNIIVKSIDSEKANVIPKEITIDLRKFGDEIKNSFKRGKYVAKITQKNGQVKTWT